LLCGERPRSRNHSVSRKEEDFGIRPASPFFKPQSTGSLKEPASSPDQPAVTVFPPAFHVTDASPEDIQQANLFSIDTYGPGGEVAFLWPRSALVSSDTSRLLKGNRHTLDVTTGDEYQTVHERSLHRQDDHHGPVVQGFDASLRMLLTVRVKGLSGVPIFRPVALLCSP
jgi:hypothetical protein